MPTISKRKQVPNNNKEPHKQQKLNGFFNIKHIAVFLNSDPKFVFITDMGNKIKCLILISKSMANELSSLERDYNENTYTMKCITVVSDITKE